MPVRLVSMDDEETLTTPLQSTELLEKLRSSGQGPVRTMKLPHTLHTPFSCAPFDHEVRQVSGKIQETKLG